VERGVVRTYLFVNGFASFCTLPSTYFRSQPSAFAVQPTVSIESRFA
jgi:hypothetical protein